MMNSNSHITDRVREAICKMFQNGVNVSAVARNLSIARSIVSSIVQQFKKAGESSKQKWHGLKTKATSRTRFSALLGSVDKLTKVLEAGINV